MSHSVSHLGSSSDTSETLLLPAIITLKSVAGWLTAQKVMNKSVKCLDFSEVKQCDSTVLGLMLYLQNQMPNDQRIIVRSFPQALVPLLELYDLEHIVEFQ